MGVPTVPYRPTAAIGSQLIVTLLLGSVEKDILLGSDDVELVGRFAKKSERRLLT
jgi:hypothetical protein